MPPRLSQKPRSDSIATSTTSVSTIAPGELTFTSLTNIPLARAFTGAGTHKAPRSTEDRIVVGIDFGTTHSAVAWALTSSPDEYEVITTWPGQVGKDWGKVPSDISYTVSRSGSSGSGESPNSSPTAEGTAPGEIGYKWFVTRLQLTAACQYALKMLM